ncbi:uncharacterized protein C8Q71DRAFT_67156 [Rhodofomes roseus]|uniref:Arrestin-like N-terminal domain-containing protein n=1 Tax=Rhodofomes roseus TaxID=34475 RepID=A0ABQ8KF40_9APHY|nr:uncharacterized protein C8Q71DRAFT_67156 [Rhodofomes roseus]KAH9836123.1 hypothetical protein C8Q71DRAFT_67156 [Rhodofomes roseus]
MSGSYLSAIRISLSQEPVVTGDVSEGTVRLDLPALGEERVGEVHAHLKGFLTTTLNRHGPTLTDTISLLQQSILLWKRGMPSPSSGILTVPFRFKLPDNLPPSFDFSDEGISVRISYSVEAAPDRSGIRSERVESTVTVVQNDPESSQISLRLAQGWNEPWTTKTISKRFRRVHGLVGDATLNLTYPSSPALPTNSNIPFKLHVVTVSSLMSRDDDGRIWPSPPTQPREILAELRQRVYSRIGSESHVFTTPVKSLWGAVEVGPFDKEWIPTEGSDTTGKWKQEMPLRSSFMPSNTPTFAYSSAGTSEVRVEYSIHLNVHFGSHYSLDLDVPVIIGSSVGPGSRDKPASLSTTEAARSHAGIDRVEPPMDWFLSVPGASFESNSSNPLRRVITAPETRPPCPTTASDQDSRLTARLEQHDLPMSWFMPGTGASASGAPGHGYTRSLELLDNSIALFESASRLRSTSHERPIPLRQVRSASPARASIARSGYVRNFGLADLPEDMFTGDFRGVPATPRRPARRQPAPPSGNARPVSAESSTSARGSRVRNYGAADVPENMFGADYGAVLTTSRRPARRRPAPTFETNRPEEAESADLPSYGDSLDDGPPPYEE